MGWLVRKADESRARWDESFYLKGSSNFSVMTWLAGRYIFKCKYSLIIIMVGNLGWSDRTSRETFVRMKYQLEDIILLNRE